MRKVMLRRVAAMHLVSLVECQSGRDGMGMLWDGTKIYFPFPFPFPYPTRMGWELCKIPTSSHFTGSGAGIAGWE